MPVELATCMLAADRDAVAAAARVMAEGGLAAFPTETVYGLGADATNGEAVARLYAAKGRPAFSPLIAHVANLDAARRLAVFDAAAEKLAAAFWPGPLTLVLPKAPGCPVCDLATAGLETVAVRVPSHPVARDIIAAFGKPVAAPSANRSGHVSPTTALHVLDDLGGRIDLIVDGGPTPIGLESTIVACVGQARLLRLGGVARADMETVLGALLAGPSTELSGAPSAPGQLASHYAPRARLRPDADVVLPGEVLLAFGPILPLGASRAIAMFSLSPSGDLMEAAANLFSYLRAADATGAHTIAVAPIPHEGLGEAINDRLRRAAAPRE